MRLSARLLALPCEPVHGVAGRRELRDAELAASAARRASMPSLSLFPGEKSGARSNGAAKPRTRLLARLAGLRRSLARDEAELAGSAGEHCGASQGLESRASCAPFHATQAAELPRVALAERAQSGARAGIREEPVVVLRILAHQLAGKHVHARCRVTGGLEALEEHVGYTAGASRLREGGPGSGEDLGALFAARLWSQLTEAGALQHGVECRASALVITAASFPAAAALRSLPLLLCTGACRVPVPPGCA